MKGHTIFSPQCLGQYPGEDNPGQEVTSSGKIGHELVIVDMDGWSGVHYTLMYICICLLFSIIKGKGGRRKTGVKSIPT